MYYVYYLSLSSTTPNLSVLFDILQVPAGWYADETMWRAKHCQYAWDLYLIL